MKVGTHSVPDLIDANGLQVASATELTAQLTSGLQLIFGADANFDPDSPDGQMIGNYVQVAVDARGVLVQINASFDPDQAIGVILDSRVALNGLIRQGGTYSTTNETIVVSSACTLQGLDLYPTAPYTRPARRTETAVRRTRSGLSWQGPARLRLSLSASTRSAVVVVGCTDRRHTRSRVRKELRSSSTGVRLCLRICS